VSHPGGLIDDFVDLLLAFEEHEVDYVVVGAHAVAAAGVVRATKDLDVFVRPSASNAVRIMRALVAFGAPIAAHGVRAADFATPGVVYQMGLPPRRIDITTAIDGVSFEEASRGAVRQRVDDLDLPFLGLRELLMTKRAAGRPQDLADIDHLSRVGTSQPDTP